MQASLESSHLEFGRCTVECKVGNKSHIILCKLVPDVRQNYHLELEFDESQEEVIFSVDVGIVHTSPVTMSAGPVMTWLLLSKKLAVLSKKLKLAVLSKKLAGEAENEKRKRDRNERVSDAEGDVPRVTKSGLKKYSSPVVIKALAIGDLRGKIALKKKKVQVKYVVKLKGKKIFDSTAPGKRPYNFCLGVGNVIKALDVGVMCMRVNEKRRLIVPRHYGWGDKQIGEEVELIPPNSYLTFDVELISVD